MLSLRSLAFILTSARRRARALSCSALQYCAENSDRQIATKTPVKIATKMAAMVQSPMNSLHFSRRSGLGRKKPFVGRRFASTRT